MPATAMSQEAIYSTLYAVLALTDSIFQIWITLTFAVLVATYVAERHFDGGMYRLVSGLYRSSLFRHARHALVCAQHMEARRGY